MNALFSFPLLFSLLASSQTVAPSAKHPSQNGVVTGSGARPSVALLIPAATKSKPAARKATVSLAAPASWENVAVEVVAGGRGRINYEAGVIKAVGLAAVPLPTLSRSRGQDMLDTRDAALADALRTLGIAVSRVRVTATTRVANYLVKSDDIKVRVESLVSNARVIEEKFLPTSGIYRIVVEAPMKGSGSLAEALEIATPPTLRTVLNETAPKPNPIIPVATVVPVVPDPFAPGAVAPENAAYTGLIVDCRGLKVESCMSPRLYDTHDDEVFGTMHVSPDYVIETGIAIFPRSMEAAKRSPRIGDRPLIVRACGVQDANRFYPVILRADAERVREANRDSHFCERTAVAFLLDPIK